jgi:hypothetical protein
MLKVESSQWLQAQKAFLLNGNLDFSLAIDSLESFHTLSPQVLRGAGCFISLLRRAEVYISEPRHGNI